MMVSTNPWCSTSTVKSQTSFLAFHLFPDITSHGALCETHSWILHLAYMTQDVLFYVAEWTTFLQAKSVFH